MGPLRHRDHLRLAGSVGELVALDAEYQRLRLIKSAEEIARLEVAARLSDLAIEAIVDQVEVGMDERQLAGIVETSYLAEGGTNHIHYFAATSMHEPDKCVPSQFQSTRRLQTGDILFCEISAAYWGYAAQVLRSFTIAADPTPLFVDLHRAADAAFDAIAAVVRPGAHAADLVEASAVIEEMGFTIYDDLVHGYGGGYLPPVLGQQESPQPAGSRPHPRGRHGVGDPTQCDYHRRAGRSADRTPGGGDRRRAQVAARRPPRTRPNRMIGLAKHIPGSDQIAAEPASPAPKFRRRGWTRIVPRIGCSRLNLWLACKRLG